MTKEEIIEMAQQCGLIGMRPHLDGIYSESIEAFAKLIAEKEREACAEIADEWVVAYPHPSKIIAQCIRERGQE